MPKHNVSRAMSTQHPDNVNHPFFSDNAELAGEDEIKEVIDKVRAVFQEARFGKGRFSDIESPESFC